MKQIECHDSFKIADNSHISNSYEIEFPFRLMENRKKKKRRKKGIPGNPIYYVLVYKWP